MPRFRVAHFGGVPARGREVNQKSISSRLQTFVVMTSAWMSHGLPSARACFAPG
jgi:hypothetical protein